MYLEIGRKQEISRKQEIDWEKARNQEMSRKQEIDWEKARKQSDIAPGLYVYTPENHICYLIFHSY